MKIVKESKDDYLVKITKEVEDRGAFATIDYRLYTGASTPIRNQMASALTNVLRKEGLLPKYRRQK